MSELATKGDRSGVSILQLMDEFVNQQGRRPRILVVAVGQDIQAESSRDVGVQSSGAKIIATAFADLGFDVDLSPTCADSKEIVRQAIENDVHLVALSIHVATGTGIGAENGEGANDKGTDDESANVLSRVSELIAEFKTQDAEDILVVTGGDLSDADHKALEQIGVTLSLRPDTQMLLAANQLLVAIVSNS